MSTEEVGLKKGWSRFKTKEVGGLVEERLGSGRYVYAWKPDVGKSAWEEGSKVGEDGTR